MRLTKKIFSIIALMLICFSAFAFAGCDKEIVEDTTKKIEVSITGNIRVQQLRQTTYEGDDYLGELESRKREAMSTAITQIVYTNNKDSTKNKTWTEDTVEDPLTKKLVNLSAYQWFVMQGGLVTGFNISLDPGTYVCRFEYDGAYAEIEYTIYTASPLN